MQALVERHTEEVLRLRAETTSSSSLLNLPVLRSIDAGASSVRPLQLMDELKTAAHHSVDASVRRDLEQTRVELEQCWHNEEQKRYEEDTAAAADVAGIELKLSQMHAGTFFDKVSFKRSVRQSRYVRFTFDCRRVEWAQQQRGPFKSIAVNSITRIDYGDASRAFRCFEFGRRDRPAPGLCMSICTASRSLDLIASSEQDIEVWILGLNELIPYRLERQRFTAQEFFLRRAILNLEATSGEAGPGACNSTSRKTELFEGECTARDPYPRHVTSGRWGFPFKR
jgi:hypothetical protein